MYTLPDRKKAKRIGILDIESSALYGHGMGYLIAACVREVADNPKNSCTMTFQLTDFKSEKEMLKVLIKVLNQYDLLMTWYGSRFDIPFLNTRCAILGVPFLKRKYRRDLCFISRGNFKFKNNRLATVGRALFGSSGKTFLDEEIWLSAIQGNPEAIEYIADHCEADVKETEKIYRKFIPAMRPLKKP